MARAHQMISHRVRVHTSVSLLRKELASVSLSCSVSDLPFKFAIKLLVMMLCGTAACCWQLLGNLMLVRVSWHIVVCVVCFVDTFAVVTSLHHLLLGTRSSHRNCRGHRWSSCPCCLIVSATLLFKNLPAPKINLCCSPRINLSKRGLIHPSVWLLIKIGCLSSQGSAVLTYTHLTSKLL